MLIQGIISWVLQKIYINKFIKMKANYLLLLCAVCILASCRPQDPSKYDIKSPCAANLSYTKDHQPCIKRSPIGNKLV
ncbi:MAG: hypothetical protein ACI8ZF_000480 [Candidatus Midichloriaceae bacterium]|jgi:hypothetical protein